MNKYIIAALLVLLLPTVGYAKCCDCCQDKSYITYGTMTMRGYAYEVKHKRLTVIELVDNETFVAVWGESSSRYYCVKCGKKLSGWMGLNNYRCPACRAEFNIKEE